MKTMQCLQRLRGRAEGRQVDGARLAFTARSTALPPASPAVAILEARRPVMDGSQSDYRPDRHPSGIL